MASEVEEVLAETLGTEVHVESVSILIPNRVIVDGFQLRDQRGRHLFDSKRLAAKIDLLPLLEGRISISSVQLFGLDAHITKDDERSPLNLQFVLDSLKSDDSEPSSPLDLRIASIIIRNSKVAYDRLDLAPQHGVFDPNHIHISRVSGHLMLPELTDDVISAKVKNLSLREDHSGLRLSNLTTSLLVRGGDIRVSDFSISTEHSSLRVDDIHAVLADSVLKTFDTSGLYGYVNALDVGCFVPQLSSLDLRVDYQIQPSFADNRLNVKSLWIHSGKDLELKAEGHYDTKRHAWSADVTRFALNTPLAEKVLTALSLDDVRQYISGITNINYVAKAMGDDSRSSLEGVLSTNVGSLKHHVSYAHGRLTADLSTDLLRFSELSSLSPFGDVSLQADVSANISKTTGALRVGNLKFSADMPLLTFHGYPYRNISLGITPEGKSSVVSLSVGDANAVADIHLTTGDLTTLINGVATAIPLSGTVDVAHVRPSALGVSHKLLAADYSLHVRADIADVRRPLDNLLVDIPQVSKRTDTEEYTIGDITVVSRGNGGRIHTLMFNSPFFTADAEGYFDIATLAESFADLAGSQLTELNLFPRYSYHDNNITFNVLLSDARPLREFLALDFSCPENVRMNGFIDDAIRKGELQLTAPEIIYNNVTYRDARALLYTRNDTLMVSANIQKMDEKGRAQIVNAQGNINHNRINSILSFNNGHERLLAGELSSSVQLIHGIDGKLSAVADINSSHIITGDTLWTVKPSKVYYSDHNIRVDGFAIEHNSQGVRIDGVVSDNPADSLLVSLKDVNVQYILDFVNFHSVEFAGYASGTAVARSLFGDKPEASTDLTVRDFLFCEGPMGTLLAHASWDNEGANILIDAKCVESDTMTTKIDGYISPTHEVLNLDINAVNTPVAFLGGICKSFMKDVSGRYHGHVNVGGPLSKIQLTGAGRFSAQVTLPSLNTTYSLHDANILMTPGEIRFSNDTVYDARGAKAFLDGAITHTFLGRWCYDLNIDAQHFLCYDFPVLNDGDVFCGKAIGTGTCHIHGRPGEIIFDIEALPEKGSIITYNVSSPESLANQDFINWGVASNYDGYESDTLQMAVQDKEDSDKSFRSNLTLNMLVHCTSDVTLRLLMDEAAGDDILLGGNGTLRASYHNKRGMQIFGNYQVERGVYNMTIRNLIKKEFTFLPQGGIAFNGPPFDAKVNLKAQYVLNSVPLSDLNIGNSLNTNGVRVNCLMNIGGVASDPQVEFALELPQASADVQQMVTSIINSQEEMNQQVVYLLAIGRFYNDSEANANGSEVSRTSLAMQSFISGTLSQQVSRAISSVMKLDNWNFSTNVSPGDEGMNNAEYEGLLSGRLFNDRLLINGQFGYRDRPNATSSFIGDFDVRYLLTPGGNMSVRVYNQTTDRYFSRNTLNTQGLGIVLKHDFNTFRDLFRRKRDKK